MRYSIHDGPGIRTTVFFKGCALSCKWCHNPESLKQEPEQVFDPEETIGYEITLPKLMEEIKKDLPFYEQSNGGVTFSGGEPLFQGEFVLEALAQCKEDCINTAIDTSGCCDTGLMLKAAGQADYFLYDIKFIDSAKHEKYCGAPNDLILKNLESLSETKTKLLIRIPLIPAINDDIPEMAGIFEFIKDFKNIESVHLLPYHNIHSGKYNRLGKQYELCDERGQEISGEESPNMRKIQSLFGSRFRTKIGG